MPLSRGDSILTVGGALVTSLYLLPTLFNTNTIDQIPFSYLTLFGGYPLLAYIGMSVASVLSRKVKPLLQLAKFGFVGILNTAIDFGILNFFIAVTGLASGPAIILANATSFSTAVINSYFWNKEWVFKGSKRATFFSFVGVTLIGLLINTGVVFVLSTYVDPILVSSQEQWTNLAKLLATVLSLIWNFSAYKLVVFKK